MVNKGRAAGRGVCVNFARASHQRCVGGKRKSFVLRIIDRAGRGIKQFGHWADCLFHGPARGGDDTPIPDHAAKGQH